MPRNVLTLQEECVVSNAMGWDIEQLSVHPKEGKLALNQDGITISPEIFAEIEMNMIPIKRIEKEKNIKERTQKLLLQSSINVVKDQVPRNLIYLGKGDQERSIS